MLVVRIDRQPKSSASDEGASIRLHAHVCDGSRVGLYAAGHFRGTELSIQEPNAAVHPADAHEITVALNASRCAVDVKGHDRRQKMLQVEDISLPIARSYYNMISYKGAADAIEMWNKPAVLIPRRKREKALFLADV